MNRYGVTLGFVIVLFILAVVLSATTDMSPGWFWGTVGVSSIFLARMLRGEPRER